MNLTIEQLQAVLQTIQHPETGQSVVAMGLVDNLRVEGNEIRFTLLFKTRDPLASSIKRACERALSQAFPAFTPNVMELVREAPKKEKKPQDTYSGLDEVKRIIAISSGKGGVGKSTVAVNLAVVLAEKGYKVGLVDADLYGPSLPKMFGMEDAQPVLLKHEDHELIEPVERFGVKMLSIGFFVKPEDPLIWRGPMATSALRQITKQAYWGELDFLLIDLPPGTGDIHLTMIQEIKLTGAVVVSTPQEVALADVIKGVNMFTNDKINVPVLGLIENMAWFTPAELPNNRYYIFGKEGCKRLAEKLNLPFLGQIPLVQSIREGGDEGQPIALQKTASAEAFKVVAENMLKQLK